jgi:hypothetical protein
MRFIEIIVEYFSELLTWATIVDSDECAIRLRFGKVGKIILSPGIYLNLPFVHSFVVSSNALRCTTSGQVVSGDACVEAVARWRIITPFLSLIVIDDIEDFIQTELQRKLFDNPDADNEFLKSELRKEQDLIGVEFDDVVLVSRSRPTMLHLSGGGNQIFVENNSE